MDISFSSEKIGKVGLAGHIGVSHAHSHSGFVQEDGAGFSVLGKIFHLAAPVDLRIAHIEVAVEQGSISITLEGGGSATAVARSGITPAEVALMQAAVGMNGLCPQTLATTIFGRVHGQGILEIPATFITALARAVVATYLNGYPEKFHFFEEDTPQSCGCYLGTVLQINGVPVSALLTVNAGLGGIGPNEDTEGNVPIGNKGRLMAILGMDALPTIIVEAKAYVPFWKEAIDKTTLIVRANQEHDNSVVGECLAAAAESLGYPIYLPPNPYPRRSGSLMEETQHISQRVVDLGNRLAKADNCGEKNAIVSELVSLVKYDMGGVVFMSNGVNDIVAHGGLLPGTAAVLSSAVSAEYISCHQIPLLNEDDLEMYLQTVVEAIRILHTRLPEAGEQLGKRAVGTAQLAEMARSSLTGSG
ncbi:MAG: hypothetical protein V2I32_04400 [Desulforhopalus sp.]|jgi:hypothetical protein|nr:hypothetical protein [Desulforhopalus sp.]